METSETPNIMKTKTLLLILITLTILSCTHSPKANVKDTDVQKQGFNGPVKYIKTELYKLIPENDVLRIGDSSLMEFNALGNFTSVKEFLSNGKTIKETKYIYNNEGRLIERKDIDNYGTGSYLNYKYHYDTHDSITEVMISSDSFIRKVKIERNERNFVIKNQLSQSDSILITYTVKYDDRNNIIGENKYRNTNIPTKLIKRSFNKQNLVVKEQAVEYQSWDTLTYENLYFYDANNKLVLVKEGMDSSSTYIEVIYRYHKNGKLKESVVTPKGSSYFTVLGEVYNENGNLISRSRTPNKNRTKEIWDYKYKYDSNNNWIEKIEYYNGKPVQITKRTIEYY